jgi:hypothetical protein
MSQKVSWIYQPTKKQFISVIIVYTFSTACLLAAMTHMFSEAISADGNLTLFILLFLSTATLLQVTFNYFKQKI